MSTEENKAAERRFYAEVWVKHNLEVVDELVAVDVVEHNPLFPGQGPGREGFRQTLETAFSAFPDAQSTIENLIAEGDTVVVRWTGRGTHRGELLGMAPSGMRFHFGGMSIFRLAEGKVAEQWEAWDKLDLLQQLGVVPTPRASR